MASPASATPDEQQETRNDAAASPASATGAAGPAASAGTDARPSFAHPSEAEFARILDFYQVPWQYEPCSFVLRSDENGRVVERFAPDFYLPDWDLYIELTTLRQSLVTKKNRKLRRLRELYPEINIKLLYRRDFHNLMRKFGMRPEDTLTPAPTNAIPEAPDAMPATEAES